ncbi:MAG: hypothetical protein GY773_19100 [Actinomycetia bacterium]|nr:hypothetical protein [Actinomycetes bacterium]
MARPVELGHDAAMGEALEDGVIGGARALARVVEPFHGITYYSRELADMRPHGYRGWWHAYFGYRPAPLGPVGAATVTAIFYNFAPRMVAKAVPDVWAIRSPADTIELRNELVAKTLHRLYGDGGQRQAISTAADLIRRALDGCDVAGRPLFAACTELEWPDDDALALWHGCTLSRELRGDSHNLALASAEVDGVMSHILMAGRGHGNRPTILAIRGWTEQEWEDGVRRLTERGWTKPDGSLTEAGNEARSAIERHTDALALEPITRLGVDSFDRLLGVMNPLVENLRQSDEVSGRWPPSHLIKPSDE